MEKWQRTERQLTYEDKHRKLVTQQKCALEQLSPTLLAPGTNFREDTFYADPGQGVVCALEYIFLRGDYGGSGLGMIQAQYIYCALYFYYYYISSSSDHQALGPRVGHPCSGQ